MGTTLPRTRLLVLVKAVEGDPLRRLFFSTDRDEPFAAMRELADQGV